VPDGHDAFLLNPRHAPHENRTVDACNDARVHYLLCRS